MDVFLVLIYVISICGSVITFCTYDLDPSIIRGLIAFMPIVNTVFVVSVIIKNGKKILNSIIKYGTEDMKDEISELKKIFKTDG